MNCTNSILQRDMTRCYICNRTGYLHTHHVFYGTANRKKSDQYGCVVALCPKHHNMSNDSVHFNKNLDMMLKARCQKAFEDKYDHETFMKVFNRNYID